MIRHFSVMAFAVVAGTAATWAAGPQTEQRCEAGDIYQSGTASIYAGYFQGRRTASAERFDHGLLTAAHKRLPFNTRVQITDNDTGRQVVVRINDRGPRPRNRIIDVSRAVRDHLQWDHAQGLHHVTLRTCH